MYFLYIVLFIIAIVVSFVNIYFAKIDNPTILDLAKASLYMLPFQYIIAFGYAYYYSEGIKSLSYLALNLSAYPILLVFGILSHFLFFRNHNFSLYEVVGIIFTLTGMFFLILSKTQNITN